LNLRNEKGIALLTVLFIIVIFTILGISVLTVTVQGAKVRGVSNEETEGKLLADMGLMYFQKYLENHLPYDPNNASLQNAIKYPRADDEISKTIAAIATKKVNDKGPFHVTSLPDGKGGVSGAFAIMYDEEYKNNDGSPAPNSRKLNVTVLGIPNQPTGDASSKLVRMRLDATLYINAIPGPFHYAISTPNDLHLYGGSNIIGGVQVGGDLSTSTSYLYRTQNTTTGQDEWKTDTPVETNQPYLEGSVLLGPSSKVEKFSTFSPADPGKDEPLSPLQPEEVDLNRQSLQGTFTPRGSIPDSGIISADKNRPYVPGFEPPLIQRSHDIPSALTFRYGTEDGLDLKTYFAKYTATLAPTKYVEVASSSAQPIAIEGNKEWNQSAEFTTKTADDFDQLSKTAVIYSNQDNVSGHAFQLTARLTGDTLKDYQQLYIGPAPGSSSVATVELGKSGSFNLTPDQTLGTPFTFTGPIYIKGNLDIVGDVKIAGTIFVDGDVVIREISNMENQNFVIMATGKITLSNRYSDKTVSDWPTLPALSAFLYSDHQAIDIYSIQSFNRINGGIATGSDPKAYIELNTKREPEGNDYASRATVQFNRGIFEKETPGLPSANRFYYDIFDRKYTTFQGDVDLN
jgi:hypothetical protein